MSTPIEMLFDPRWRYLNDAVFHAQAYIIARTQEAHDKKEGRSLMPFSFYEMAAADALLELKAGQTEIPELS